MNLSSSLKILSKPLWIEILRKNFTSVELLVKFLELNEEQCSQLVLKSKFPIKVPLRLAQKMEKRTLNDPLVLQFLPVKQELESSPEFIADPVCDLAFKEKGKLLHKYRGRVLLLCTSACAMHCRYCFRQNFDYEKEKLFDDEIEWIKADSTIHEVILSGGDPLSFSNEVLANLLKQLTSISHIKRVRFHTRFPIGIPERIDEDFLSLIAAVPQQVYFVIHCNHPRELDQDIFDRLKLLQKLGCIILNQAVLLKGVNDKVETLLELCEMLSNEGIIPYYLHQLDRVSGASHFEVSEEQGRYLIAEIAKQLPGYAVPKYVREIAGEPNKTSMSLPVSS